MAVLVGWVGGRWSEYIDADCGASFAAGVGVLVVGASGVVFTDINRPLCFESRDGVGRVQIEVVAVSTELSKGSRRWRLLKWRPIELVCDYWKVWMYISNFPRHVFC